MEEQHYNRQNSAQLNHHVKHTLKRVGYVQSDKFVQQNQMSRGGNGQPLRHALHNAEQYGL